VPRGAQGLFGTNAAGERKEAIERFVEKHEPDDLRNAESVLDALRRVKVLRSGLRLWRLPAWNAP